MNPVFGAAVATFIGTAACCSAAVSADMKNLGYVVDQNYNVVLSGKGECVRSGVWTPALAAAAAAARQCTPDLVAQAEPAAAPSVAPTPKPALNPEAKPKPKPDQASTPAKPAPQKIDFSADTLFDFDKAELKPEGKATLDTLPRLLQGAQYEVIRAVGHTDRIGSAQYNQKLSVKRAEAVKKYLVDQGIAANRIAAEGRGESQPLTKPGTCTGKNVKALIACLQPDRRVAIEVTGTK